MPRPVRVLVVVLALFRYVMCSSGEQRIAVDSIACKSPLGRGGAQRRGGFFLATTHPEAFGFCPSQEGINSLVVLHSCSLVVSETSYR